MRMRGKSRSQLTVRYTCKAYSGMYHVNVLVHVNVNVPEAAKIPRRCSTIKPINLQSLVTL